MQAASEVAAAAAAAAGHMWHMHASAGVLVPAGRQCQESGCHRGRTLHPEWLVVPWPQFSCECAACLPPALPHVWPHAGSGA